MTISFKNLKQKIKSLEEVRDALIKEIETRKIRIEEINDNMYELKLEEIHVLEIYRLARKHFPRLRDFSLGHDLTKEDVLELEKWIGRAKDTDGLKAIVEALNELQKYVSSDVKSNLYALVQRIIIGGAYHQKRTHK